MAEDEYPVKLHIYDLSQGMARQLSATILGKVIEGIWHTGVVVYGREYYFGGGIQQGQPGRTPYGTPVRVEDLGVTHVPREVFEDFLRDIGPRYTPATYSLLTHNCNNFSNEAAQFLASATVPSYILELPTQVMNSPIAALIMPMIQGLETSLRAGAVPQPPQFKRDPAPVVAVATETKPSAKDVVVPPVAGKKTAGNGDGRDGSPAVPPVVQHAAPPAALVATAATTAKQPPTNDVEARSPAAAAKPEAPATEEVEAGSAAADKTEAGEPAGSGDGNGGSPAVPPAVQPAAAAPPEAAAQVSATAPVAVAAAPPPDPLTEAKRRAEEEIRREFAAIMANGTARASEAAALAMRRVMERHGLQRAAAAQRG